MFIILYNIIWKWYFVALYNKCSPDWIQWRWWSQIGPNQQISHLQLPKGHQSAESSVLESLHPLGSLPPPGGAEIRLWKTVHQIDCGEATAWWWNASWCVHTQFCYPLRTVSGINTDHFSAKRSHGDLSLVLLWQKLHSEVLVKFWVRFKFRLG